MNPLTRMAQPQKFDFQNLSGWSSWIKRFERYRMAYGFMQKPGEHQVNAPIFAMGDTVGDILCSLFLTAEDQKSYKTAREAFDNHFIGNKNVMKEQCLT